MNTFKSIVVLLGLVSTQSLPENNWLEGFTAATTGDMLNRTELQMDACFKFDTGSLFVDVMAANEQMMSGNFSDIVESINALIPVLTNYPNYFQNDTAGCRVPMGFYSEPIQDWAYPIISDPDKALPWIANNTRPHLAKIQEMIKDTLLVHNASQNFSLMGEDYSNIMQQVLGNATAPHFPGFDFFHAHCEMSTDISSTCDQVYDSFNTTVSGMMPGGATPDPAGGIYKMKYQEVNETVWATRTTPTKHYIDDILFELNGSSDIADSCKVTAYSRSRTLSYYDYDTNYCNMYNVLRTSGLKFSTPSTTQCKWVPKDMSVCDKY